MTSLFYLLDYTAAVALLDSVVTTALCVLFIPAIVEDFSCYSESLFELSAPLVTLLLKVVF